MYKRQNFRNGSVLMAAHLNSIEKSLVEDIPGNQWYGKTWYAYGTSLTSEAQGKYVPYVAQLSGMTVVNKGIPGGGIVNNSRIKNAIMNTDDGKLEADLITLEVSANDVTGVTLGTATDSGNETFCGVLTQCIAYLLQNTRAQIVVMMSTSEKSDICNPNTNFKYLDRAVEMRKVCMKCGVPFIGFSDSSGLGWYRANNNLGISYHNDNIHHNNLGGYNLAQYIWSQLKNIPLWYTEIPQIDNDDDEVIEYNVTYNLTNVSCSTSQEKAYSNQEFVTLLEVDDGYALESVSVLMDNIDITESNYSNLNVTIPRPSGDIIISAVAIKN